MLLELAPLGLGPRDRGLDLIFIDSQMAYGRVPANRGRSKCEIQRPLFDGDPRLPGHIEGCLKVQLVEPPRPQG
jgi:hypothetical protein